MEPHEATAAPASGNENVAAALEELATLAGRALAEQPDGFARVHANLQRALADVDDA